ncbi:hypothetical protein C0992_006949 [Termitomyces sp. T32_za158]|nr:hypothetical protein C0992_006949 [Termitomyces sp. T32_za158]
MTHSLLLHWVNNLQWFCNRLLCIAYADSSSSEQSNDVEEGLVLPTAYADNLHSETYTSPLQQRQSDVGPESLKSPPLSFASAMNGEYVAGSTSPAPVSPGRQLWTSALRTVKMHSAISSPPPEPSRQRTSSSNIMERTKALTNDVGPGKAVMRSRVAALSPQLKQLEPTQDVAAHTGLVRHLQFSPDGRYLATSRSPIGDRLLTKLSRGVKDLAGKILDQYDFGHVRLHDVAVTPDSLRLIGVGPLLESPDGLQPSKSRVEKRLVVYNMGTNLVENQTPVLNDVRDITVATSIEGGIIALISYENKAPPQLWKLELLKDKENPNLTKGRLTLRHTYMPKVRVDFAGPSYFGGKNNEMVFCAAGDIHIWDQESAALLHYIRGQYHGGDLTCIAWNHAVEDPFMFATGSHDGAVRIWTKRSDDNLSDENVMIRSSSPAEFLEEEKLHNGSLQQYSNDDVREPQVVHQDIQRPSNRDA